MGNNFLNINYYHNINSLFIHKFVYRKKSKETEIEFLCMTHTTNHLFEALETILFSAQPKKALNWKKYRHRPSKKKIPFIQLSFISVRNKNVNNPQQFIYRHEQSIPIQRSIDQIDVSSSFWIYLFTFLLINAL